MTFLPIAERELRVLSRRPKTYRGRTIAALIALIILGYFFWLFSHLPTMAGTGRQVFSILTQCAFLYCLFGGGVAVTADCLSREKREGTLGFLFLTHLKSYDILAGKLVATSLTSLYGLLAVFPILAIAILAGGVQAGEFWRVVLGLLNAVFFALCSGLLVSSLSWQERRAMQSAAWLMVLFGIALPAFTQWRVRQLTPEFALFLNLISPSYTLSMVPIPTASGRYFWWSLAAVHVLAWMFLTLACWFLPRSWQEKAERAKPQSWRERWHQWSLGNPLKRAALRRRLLDRNPFYWLAARERLTVLETWMSFVAVIGIALWAVWKFRAAETRFVISIMTLVALHAIVKFQFAAAASARLAEDRQIGALELLLSTPLSIGEILKGYRLALWRGFATLIAATIFVDLVMLLLALTLDLQSFSKSDEFLTGSLLLFLATSLMLIADAVTLCWVGMWQGVSAKQGLRARRNTIFWVLVFPWVIFFPLISVMGIYSDISPRMAWVKKMEFPHFLGLWFAIGILNNFIFAWRSRRKLYAEFRTVATEQFQSEKPQRLWWKVRRQKMPVTVVPLAAGPS